ncbi:MAG: S-layer homology domain-containing protein, partial [Bacillota bacterium]|nr:S-layer homology domain-containing protein [Bacillota bacterium]
AITVTNVNEIPSITSSDAANFAENSIETAYASNGTDPDKNDTLTWSISGTDAALFNIDSNTGAVTFKSAPDYETPTDSGADNIYNITVAMTDAGGLKASKDVAITVTNVNEAPKITSGTTVSYSENGTNTVYTATGIDQDTDDTLIWGISGADAGLFNIDSGTGVVTFKNTPHYSNPADSDKNNVYEIIVTASDGNLTTSQSVSVTVTFTYSGQYPPATPGSNPGSANPGSKDSESLGSESNIMVNGQFNNAGNSETKTESSGQVVTTVTVDTEKLGKILDSQDTGATVTIPVTNGANVASGVLTGEMVKTMETKDATLEIKTDSAKYTLPASEININAVSNQLGTDISLSDIKVNVSIAEPTEATAKVVADAASNGGYTVEVPAVDFTISCSYNGKTVNVSSFNSYVERMITIPEGVDHNKITTGVVVKPDGITYHVPTQVVVINGVYYAKINSLTNSTYAVVWHPMEFSDVSNHWAKDAVNDMGSRMVIDGVGNNNFDPDRYMTRAEFAAIVVRALGLAPGMGKCGFNDVGETAWYRGYIETAYAYEIINGYSATEFGPNDQITREQAMAMIARAMKITGLNADITDSEINNLLGTYSDGIAVSDYAKKDIAVCIKTGIVSGESSNDIVPRNNVTRAEVAVMVRRLLQKSKLI